MLMRSPLTKRPVGVDALTVLRTWLFCLLPCWSCISALTPALAFPMDRSIAQYGHRSWRVQDGFFNGQLAAVGQTTDGYLWIGGTFGLVRFDGVRFLPMPLPSSNASGLISVTALLGTEDGALWIGTTRGLFRYDHGDPKFIAGTSGSIRQLLSDQDHGVWLSRTELTQADRDRELCHVSSLSARCYGRQDGVVGTDLRALAKDRNGALWFGARHIVEQWSPWAHHLYPIHGVRNYAELAGVNALAIAADGTVWVGEAPAGKDEGASLEVLKGASLRPYRSGRLGIPGQQIFSMAVDRDGSLWAATTDQGLFRLSDGHAEHYGRADGLTGDQALNVFEDRDGDIWVATSKGLDCFFQTPVVSYAIGQGLSTDEIDSVAPARSGVWLGTTRGIHMLPSGAASDVPNTKFSPRQVSALFDDGAGHTWAGIGDDLEAEDKGHVTRITRSRGRSLGFVYSLTSAGAGNSWAEVMEDGVEHLLRVSTTAVLEDIPSSVVPNAMPMAYDGHGLWLGGRSGDLLYFANGHTTRFPFPHAATERIRQIRLLSDGTVLAATTFGLLGLRPGHEEQLLSTQNGLPCKSLRGFSPDERGNLWITSECGIYELTSTELKQWFTSQEMSVHPTVLQSTDGIQPNSSVFGASARSGDGKIWFATGGELQMVDPAHIVPPITPAKPRIECTFADTREYDNTGLVRFPPKPREIEIDYTSPTLSESQAVLFRFRLHGHNDSWVQAGTRRQAFFNDLSPGRYTFEVMAGRADGQWNDSIAHLNFEIAPTFYQTPWFRTLSGLALCFMFWGGYRWRLHQATETIHNRLSERVLERERIARELHDTLLQGFQGLLLRFYAVQKQLAPEEPARGALDDVMDRGDALIQEARLRVRALRMEKGQADSLYAAIKIEGEQMAKTYRAHFAIECHGKQRSLQVVCQEEMTGIAKEALANAFRHAEASQIIAEIHFHARGLTLRVSDDGRGIDADVLQRMMRPDHFGIPGMRERARVIGADFTIASPSAGTIVTAYVPARIAYSQ